MTDARRRLWVALLLARTQPTAAIHELEGLHDSTVDPRLRTKLWPALVALRNGRRTDVERWISRLAERWNTITSGARSVTFEGERESAARTRSKSPTRINLDQLDRHGAMRSSRGSSSR